MRPELGRSFGSAVEDYVRGRPGWPPEAIAAPGTWRNVFAGSRFGPIEEAAFEHEQALDRDGLVSYFLSQSTAASRPSEERRAIRAELLRLILPGEYVRPLRAEVFWTRLGNTAARKAL